MSQIHVVLVDDHDLVLRALTAALQAEADIEVVGTAKSVDEALQVAAEAAPDVVVMDYRLPDGDGVTATKQLLRALPGVRVVMLSGRDDPATRLEAMDAGCSGFVTKGAKLGDLAGVLRAAASEPDSLVRSTPRRDRR